MSLTGEHARSSLAALMERGVLVAESAGAAGAIVGLMALLWFNPTVSVAAEFGWWVDERFRGSSAGVKLARHSSSGDGTTAPLLSLGVRSWSEGEAPAGGFSRSWAISGRAFTIKAV